jgi:dCMP deaminase
MNQQGQNKRLSFEEIYMQLAFMLARRSTCVRLQVGAVVVSEDYSRVYGIGYNGNAKGLPNQCESNIPGDCGCLHAEDNALLKVAEGPQVPKIMFITHQPCAYCAKRIVNKGGIKKVYFCEPYRLTRGLEILRECGIEVVQVELAKN